MSTAIILILVFAAVIFLSAKLILWILKPWFDKHDKFKEEMRNSQNPYIKLHQAKFKNDALYDEYLQWLDKKGGDIPFEKWKTNEDLKAEKDLNKHLNI